MNRDERPNVKNVLARPCAHVLALLAVLILLPAAARAQWTTPDASGNTNTAAGINNVGVGTASPTSKLDVTGTAAVSGDLKVAGGRFKFTFSGPEGQMQGVTERLSFWTPNSSAVQTMRMRIGGNTSSYVEFLNVNSVYLSSASAKFGIGTSNPTSKFHLVSGTDSGTTMLHMDTGMHGGTAFAVGGTANNESTLDMSVYRAGLYVSRFGVSNYGHVYLQPGGGLVGVGTSAPEGILDVRGLVASSGAGLPIILSAQQGASSGGAGGNVIINAGPNGSNSANGQLVFGTGGVVSGGVLTTGERMRIDDAGRVGIGTPTPGFKLDVSGQIRSSSGGFVFPDGTTQTTAASSVAFGSTAGTAVQGNTVLTVTAGTGLSGDGPTTLGAGGTLTLTNSDAGSSQNIFKNVANAAGATQFSAGSNTDALRFEGTGATTISFDAANKKVVVNSPAAVPSGWTDGGTSVSVTSAAAKVGMGVSNLSAGLDVQTPVTAATAYGARLQQTLTAQINNGTLNGLYINPTFNDGVAVGNTHNALATGAGNVGIGTTATGAGLDVQNAGVLSEGASYGARFKQTIPAANNNADSTALYIEPTFSDGAAVGVRHNGLVVASGNVGIGTASPSNNLHLFAPASSAPIGAMSIDVGSFNTGANASNSYFFRVRDIGGSSTRFYICGDGNVGIGTAAPQATLDVVGFISATQTINATGAITGGSIQARYQDVAEWVPSTQKLAAGTVVVLDTERTNHVLASTKAYDTGVAGVISDSPGVILGQSGEDKLKVATTGRVRVKVDATRAAIHVGDLLVTSDTEGVAMRSVEVDLGGVKIHRPGTIIGKALEPLACGTGEILVLLSLQ
ncbi:MAG: hypothetical protein ACJ74Q_21960 [Pyrinomonadaceae bacterium]